MERTARDDRSTQTVGVIGVGRMGARLVPHLGSFGTVLAHDADATRRGAVEAAGARWIGELVAVAGAADVLLTVLPGPVELLGVMRRALPSMADGSLWIDLTSGDPHVTAELAHTALGHGVDVVSAPMGGSLTEAETASMTLYASGAPTAVERAEPVLRLLARQGGVRRAGDRAEDGQIVKLLTNALWFANAAAAGEALLLGQALGLPVEHLHALLRDGAGGSVFMSEHADRLLDGDYLETFGIDRVVDELDTVASLAAASGTPTSVLDTSAGLHRAALERYGPVPGELLGVRLLEERAGAVLRRTAGNVDAGADADPHAESGRH